MWLCTWSLSCLYYELLCKLSLCLNNSLPKSVKFKFLEVELLSQRYRHYQEVRIPVSIHSLTSFVPNLHIFDEWGWWIRKITCLWSNRIINHWCHWPQLMRSCQKKDWEYSGGWRPYWLGWPSSKDVGDMILVPLARVQSNRHNCQPTLRVLLFPDHRTRE